MRRKPMMLDAELVDAVKNIANKHGMTLAAYMRSLLTNLIEAENRGLFAPLALRKALLFSKLRGVGLLLIPADIISECDLDENDLEREGERIGILLKNLGVRLEEAIELFLENLKTAIREKDKIIVMTSNKTDRAIKGFVKGVAKAYGAEMREEGDILVIGIGAD